MGIDVDNVVDNVVPMLRKAIDENSVVEVTVYVNKFSDTVDIGVKNRVRLPNDRPYNCG